MKTLALATIPLLMALAPAHAEPLSGVIPCAIEWDPLPAAQIPHAARIAVFIDGAWAGATPPSATSIRCDEIGITAPGAYRLSLITRAHAESGWSESEWVHHDLLLHESLGPDERRFDAPTHVRLTTP